jgi:hypothetical protein
VAVRRAPEETVREMANRLFHDALLAVEDFGHVRPWAYSVLGADQYLRSGREDGWVAELRERLAGRLFDAWRACATEEWPWWEDELTWGNAKLAHALITSGAALGREDMMAGGLRTLRWLLDVQTAEDGHISIVGNNGWYVRGEKCARFDQQPIEAYSLVDACLAAAEATGEDRWVREARRCFEWFLGKNDMNVPLVDRETGGCRDGLNAKGVNANEGAESTLAYVISLLGLRLYRSEHGATEAG